jgi:glycine cleavage system H protein
MRFTDSHEWIKVENGIGTVGITEHAQKELGEVVFVELPSVGKQVNAGDEVAVLESTKAAADIYSPVTGEVIEINQKLGDFIHELNASAESSGWLFRIKLSDPTETDKLLKKEDYLNLIH